MHYTKLNVLLIEILDVIKDYISLDLYESNKEYIFVGEPGIAFDNICSYIDDYNIPISRKSFSKIELAGNAMNIDSGSWAFLMKHIK